MSDFYIGLMSGTSADGIDAALVDFSKHPPQLVATHYVPYSQPVREKILSLCQKGEDEIQRLGELDSLLGHEFAFAVNALLKQQTLNASAIKAIGSHGQTIRHFPHQPNGFSLQIGDPNTIAANTGITTVADFRRKDIAFGGQGAPLVPAFHQQIFSSEEKNRAVINIGGIANVTLLPKADTKKIIGFDTGPGNVLMDAWIYKHLHQRHDESGQWAKQGNIQHELLNRLLSDNYFKLSPPKSTGREYFNLAWLQDYLDSSVKTTAPVDVQATLLELTAQTIINAVSASMPQGELLICGGGTQNHFLMQRLQALATPHFTVYSTEKFGIDPNWVEAVAFAWLARQTMERQPGNLPSVTGAKRSAVLGGVYFS